MTDQKRSSALVVSPRKGKIDKRRRETLQKENTPNGCIKPTKTRYIFNPSNSLSTPTPLKSIKNLVHIPEKSEEAPDSCGPKPLVRNDTLSSDDHVFWAPTPKSKKKVDRTTETSTQSMIPSSPMRKEMNVDPLSTLTKRYDNIDFDNLASQRPSNRFKFSAKSNIGQQKKSEKSVSGNSAVIDSKLLESKSFAVTPGTSAHHKTDPSKLTTLESLIFAIENGFGTDELLPKKYHSDLEADALRHDSANDEDEILQLQETLAASRMPEVSPTNGEPLQEPTTCCHNPGDNSTASKEFFSEDFSDDLMGELDQLLERKTQQSNSNQIDNIVQDETTEEIVDEVTLKLNQNRIDSKDSDDDFSDLDNDELDAILQKATQKPAASKPFTTQEQRIMKADKEGSIVFKKDIDETDQRVEELFKRDDKNLAKCAVEREFVHRFQVITVIESSYTVRGQKKTQKILTVRDADENHTNIVLRDLWSTLQIETKDVVHVVGKDFKMVDSISDNLLIWNPDSLLSATLIGDTVNCMRRPVLKTRLEFRGENNMALIVGEIVHSLFQSCLRESNPTDEFLHDELEAELEENKLRILMIDETKESVREEVQQHIPYIREWFSLYVNKSPSAKGLIRESGTRNRTWFAASNVLDIEENIWSPVYGLRGLIDVTIEACFKGSTAGKFIAPLELKSGKRAHISHSAQASLYTLLLKDRYDVDVGLFILVYTKLKETTKYGINQQDLKSLIIMRNRLSSFLKEGQRKLPSLAKNSSCDNCYALQECMTYNKLMEDGTAEDSGLKDGVYEHLTEHLETKIYQDFFNYWDDLITKEESVINLLKHELFLVDSKTREETTGTCLSRMVLKEDANDNDEMEENKTYHYTFVKANGVNIPEGIHINPYDRILVSDESGHYALCSGFVTKIRPTEITLSTNRRLKYHNIKLGNFNKINNQRYQSVLKPMSSDENIVERQKIAYRIDKDETFHGMKLARYNLLNLFLKDGDHLRRELIVDNRKPQFSPEPLPHELPPDHHFNEDQLRAFEKVLSSEDYSLILGMPGTGKTTVIAQLLRFLVSNGKTVLLTSYTHSAVDNILLKMNDDDIGILRLGSLSKIHPEAQKYSPLTKTIETKKDLERTYLDPPIVATTCLSISDWVFRQRRFDYCIVDESSQVSMPICIGPLGLCEKFVLVGDHYQLPPLIKNPSARQGLSRSLFKMLSESHSDAVVELTYQYRMCSDIMLLSNTLIYEGRLQCGSREVAGQKLVIPGLEKLKDKCISGLDSKNNWIATVMDESKKVIFLNHDLVGGCDETAKKEHIENIKESELIYQIVQAMLYCGVAESSIGIMSFYRAQLGLFLRKFNDNRGIEILTADRFQGRDKDCVIISLVRSNDRNDPGSLLKEWRRVNVAITRARSKLIIVGSKKTLQNLKTIDAFMKILDSRGWFYDLPPQAETFYTISSSLYSNEAPITKQMASTSTVSSTQEKSRGIIRALKNRPLAKNIAQEMGIV